MQNNAPVPKGSKTGANSRIKLPFTSKDTFEKKSDKNNESISTAVKFTLAAAAVGAGIMAVLSNPSRAANKLVNAKENAAEIITETLKEPFITPKLEQLYQECFEKLSNVSKKAKGIIDSLDLSLAKDTKVEEIVSSIDTKTAMEEVLNARMTLLRYLTNAHSDVYAPSRLNIDELSKQINLIRKNYSTGLNERLSGLIISDINKNLPDVEALVAELSQKHGLDEKQCAQIVEKITRFSGFDDFRDLAPKMKDTILVTTDEVGFDQAGAYLMAEKLKCVQKMKKIADFSKLGELDPNKNYTILLDDFKLKSLEGIELPNNVRGIYVGDIANNNNVFTSFSADSIKKRFFEILQNQTQEATLPKGITSFDELEAGTDVFEVLKKRFSSKVKPEGFKFDVLPYYKGGLTLDESRQLSEHRYDLLKILDDEDITKGLKNLDSNVRAYASRMGVQDGIQYAIQAPSTGYETKSQHLLAYKLKCLNPDTSFAYMRKTPEGVLLDAANNTKLVAYVDDYSGSGESLEKVAKAIMNQGDRQYVMTPLVCAPETAHKLTNEFAQTNTKVFDPIFSVKNSGIVDSPAVSTIADLKKALDENKHNFINIDDIAQKVQNGTIDLTKNPLEGFYTYEVYNGRLSQLYASKLPPAIALDSVTGYKGSATAVLLPYMSPNTNSRNMNLIFKDTLRKVNRNMIKTAVNYKIKPAQIAAQAS